MYISSLFYSIRRSCRRYPVFIFRRRVEICEKGVSFHRYLSWVDGRMALVGWSWNLFSFFHFSFPCVALVKWLNGFYSLNYVLKLWRGGEGREREREDEKEERRKKERKKKSRKKERKKEEK